MDKKPSQQAENPPVTAAFDRFFTGPALCFAEPETPEPFMPQPAATPTVFPGRSLRILLVEDEPALARNVLDYLTKPFVLAELALRCQALQTFSIEQAGSQTINLQLAWSALGSSQFRQQFAD